MEKRQPVGILSALQCGFVHQAADSEVCHHRAIELLPDQVRRFAAQHDPRTTQMSFEFVERGFDLPAVVIECGQFGGWLILRENPEPVSGSSCMRQEFRDLRQTLGLGYEEFAARFNVSKGAVVGWESGASLNCDDHIELLRLGLEDLGTPRQLTLPFGQTFSVEMKIGTQRAAGSVDVRVQLRERVN